MGTIKTFTPAPTAAEQLEAAQRAAVQRVNDGYREQVAPMVREYPIEEQQGWGQQDAESQAYLAWYDAGQQGTAPATPVLDRILAGRNGNDGTETLYDLCLAVRENAELFIQAQELTGRRQRLVKQVQAAATVSEADSITW
ncbi:hypothetical protein [Halomonas koreensis]|uniref:DUF4376 domain-containing protein n=1 Tax=Halomonas koreensis TaxID=245385 RepID=A0ABU1G4Q6_9GAMM|nr:hypothetical protein [Halomonas koreensis]MDR5867922.1 hypothetical protein [Halomonas koreensis]